LRKALPAIVAATAAALVVSSRAGISFAGGETTRIAIYYVALFGSVALLVAGAAFVLGERLAWSFLALGLLLWAAGDLRVALGLATIAVVVAVSRTVVFARRYVAALREIGELARIDALTGLANRRAFLDDFAELLLTVEHGERWNLVLFDLDNFKAYNDTLGHPAGDAMLAMLAGRLQESVRQNGSAYRLGGDEFCVLIRRDGHEEAMHRAAELALCAGGPGFSIDSSNGSVLIPEEAVTAGDALRLADERLYRHKQARPGSVERLLSEALLQAMAEHSPQFVEHHENVARLAETVADAAGMSEADRDDAVRAARLHDIGKLAVPDGILRKIDPLSEAERDLIRAHTVVGERILRVAASMRSVAHLVRSSHERWDGHGYPDGLAGSTIPLGARIVAICDSLDAMLSERPYAPSKTLDAALAELGRERGKQFDPVLVDLVLELHAEGRLPVPARQAPLPILRQPARPWKAALANAAA
jgi:two-component system cell cycle response regulator